MRASDVNTLLEQINALVDNSTGDLHDCALEVQRMAANLPRLHRSAVSGWRSLGQLAIAFEARASEHAAIKALEELGGERYLDLVGRL